MIFILLCSFLTEFAAAVLLSSDMLCGIEEQSIIAVEVINMVRPEFSPVAPFCYAINQSMLIGTCQSVISL